MISRTADDNTESYDVAILGGGLAGLTLALQCRQEIPNARIAVIERNQHPVPEAAFKVGESTVEVATYYFAKVLGLEGHLREEQLPKLGLRFFFRAGDNSAINRRLEFGGKEFPPTASYQIDRGRFENFLAEHCSSKGVEFMDGAKIKNVQLHRGRGDHEVRFERDGLETTVSSRWIADCSGRAGILKRKLGLEKSAPHHANAAWFRIKAEIKIDDWSDDPAWREGFEESFNPRWLSTNHLMGDGYWVWLIPLATGSTSIGIVADEKMHPLSGFNSLEKALTWLDKHEPQCARQVRSHQSQIQDFHAMKRFAMECKQVFSYRRWGITGEAGYFLDPFYSPGSDFIAFGNSFLCELIKRDLAGKYNRFHAYVFDFLYKRLYHGTAPVFQDQYPLFGNHQVMPVKIFWDYLIYWTLSGFIYCHGRSSAPLMYARNFLKLQRLDELNRAMQSFFREWHVQTSPCELAGSIDAWDIPLVIDTNRSLMDELDDQKYRARFADNVAQMETLFWEIIDRSGVQSTVALKRRNYPRAKKGCFDRLFEQLSDATSRKPDHTLAVHGPSVVHSPASSDGS